MVFGYTSLEVVYSASSALPFKYIREATPSNVINAGKRAITPRITTAHCILCDICFEADVVEHWISFQLEPTIDRLRAIHIEINFPVIVAPAAQTCISE